MNDDAIARKQYFDLWMSAQDELGTLRTKIEVIKRLANNAGRSDAAEVFHEIIGIIEAPTGPGDPNG